MVRSIRPAATAADAHAAQADPKPSPPLRRWLMGWLRALGSIAEQHPGVWACGGERPDERRR